jgi:hypothetical protein
MQENVTDINEESPIGVNKCESKCERNEWHSKISAYYRQRHVQIDE